MSLFKSTAWYTIGQLFSRSIGFILLPFYSNLIPTVDFADYSLIMSAYLVVSAVYHAGLHYSLTKYYLEAKEDSDRQKVFSTIFSVIIIWSLLLSAAFTISSASVAGFILGTHDKGGLINLAIWMLFADSFFYTAVHLLKVLELSKKVTLYTSIYSIINLLLNILLVFFLNWKVTGILTAQLIAGVLLSLIILPFLLKYYRPSVEPELLFRMILFSLPLLLSDLFSNLVDVIDRFILDHYLDKTAVGLYSFSYRIAMIMNVFVIAFRTAWTPYSIRLLNEDKNHPEIFGKSLSKFAALSMLVFLTVSILIDDAFRFSYSGVSLFNLQYEPGTVIIPFVLIAYAIGGAASFYTIYPFVSGKSYHFLISEAIGLFSNVIFNVIFIPRFGLIGAAVSMVLSMLAVLIYLIFAAGKIKIKYQGKELFVIITSAFLLFGLSVILDLLIADILIILAFILFVRKLLSIKLTAMEIR